MFRCGRFYISLLVLAKRNSKLYSSKHNLTNSLINMPREPRHHELTKLRKKIKEKGSKYSPGTVNLQVLGSGAPGAPRSLYVFTDQSKYMFNCGEGSQRLAHEHKMKLSKLEHIFVTYPSWQNIGGLPGVALTIQDVGVPELSLHGPPCIDDIFTGTKRFVILRNLSINMSECDPTQEFEDNVMFVKYVPLLANQINPDRPITDTKIHVDSESEDNEDQIDYYAHEKHGRTSDYKISGKTSKKRRNSKSRKSDDAVEFSMAYICRLKTRPGTLNLEACVDRGVPPGPLLGRLKKGEDVVLEGGCVVRSSDVTTPEEPGPIFIVVECPSEAYLDSLMKETSFHCHQANASCEEDVAYLVVHFTPPHVMKHPKYQEWMKSFAKSTSHLTINDENKCMGSIAVHRLQYKLNLLHPSIFPLLKDDGFPLVLGDAALLDVRANLEKELKNRLNEIRETKPVEEAGNYFPVIRGKTLSNFLLRPMKGLNRARQLVLTPNEYIDETLRDELFIDELNKLHKELEKVVLDSGEFPKFVFLGTGSCIPNKSRNTSGILLFLNPEESLILDCGEGTYGQIVRLYGREESDRILRGLKGIYVSHLHADHHIGLVGLLSARRTAFQRFQNEQVEGSSTNIPEFKPLYLMAPKQIMPWLTLCHKTFEPVLSDFIIIPNGDLAKDHGSRSLNIMKKFLADMNMSNVSTVEVLHCPDAFGVSITHVDGWKLTYSGDTLPCGDLVELGLDSDVLIHEATMEDELEHEAKAKLHSTTSQAIAVGRGMKAKFVLLTHFSQRYAKLPRLNDLFTGNVGIAFDNMTVSLQQLPLLPKMYDALKMMFAEHCDELEVKAVRRQLREERKRAASTSPDREIKVHSH